MSVTFILDKEEILLTFDVFKHEKDGFVVCTHPHVSAWMLFLSSNL